MNLPDPDTLPVVSYQAGRQFKMFAIMVSGNRIPIIPTLEVRGEGCETCVAGAETHSREQNICSALPDCRGMTYLPFNRDNLLKHITQRMEGIL